jgi:hypothetical protein
MGKKSKKTVAGRIGGENSPAVLCEGVKMTKALSELPEYDWRNKDVRRTYASLAVAGKLIGVTTVQGSHKKTADGDKGAPIGGYPVKHFDSETGVEAQRMARFGAIAEEKGAGCKLGPKLGEPGTCPFGFSGSAGSIGRALCSAAGPLTMGELIAATTVEHRKFTGDKTIDVPASRVTAHVGSLKRMGIVTHVGGKWELTAEGRSWAKPAAPKGRKPKGK